MTASVSRWLKAFAALIVLGVVLGTATIAIPANAAYTSFGYQGDNQGNGS